MQSLNYLMTHAFYSLGRILNIRLTLVKIFGKIIKNSEIQNLLSINYFCVRQIFMLFISHYDLLSNNNTENTFFL